jgi:RHS repeat-associated protein
MPTDLPLARAQERAGTNLASRRARSLRSCSAALDCRNLKRHHKKQRRACGETLLGHARARFFDAALGRFVGRDPIGYSQFCPSLYLYVSSQPQRHTDPRGTSSCTVPSPHIQNVPTSDFYYPTRVVHGPELSAEVSLHFLGDDPYFAHYYYQGGKTFHLAEYGLLDDFRRATTRDTLWFNQLLLSLAELELGLLECKTCRYGDASDVDSRFVTLGPVNIPYEFAHLGVATYIWEPNFALGGPRTADSFTAQGLCEVTLYECNRPCSAPSVFDWLFAPTDLYSIDCESHFVLNDKFTDPWDLNDTIPGEHDSSGTAYPIHADWTERWHSDVSRSCGAKSGGTCQTRRE